MLQTVTQFLSQRYLGSLHHWSFEISRQMFSYMQINENYLCTASISSQISVQEICIDPEKKKTQPKKQKTKAVSVSPKV